MTKTTTSQKTTTWAAFRQLTGAQSEPLPKPPRPVKQVSPEIQREQDLAVRLKGPEATFELVHHLGSMQQGEQRTLLMSGGEGAFAAQFAEAYHNGIVVLHSDPLVVEALKARVLGSVGAVTNHLKNPERKPEILREHIIRPGIEYRLAELPKTSLADGSFSLVVIEQGHVFGLQGALAEASRLLCDNGVIVLLGYMPMHAVARQKPAKDLVNIKFINEALDDGFERALSHFVSEDERALLNAYSQISFPFEDIPGSDVFDDFRRRMFMRAAWRLDELKSHMASWPVVKRLEESGSISNILWWNFWTTFQQTWGSPRTRRVLNWPVALRIGAKVSQAKSDHPAEQALLSADA